MLIQPFRCLDEKSNEQFFDFCRRVAGSCEIVAAFTLDDYASVLADSKAVVQVFLVIRGFQPRLMNYVKVLEERSIIVFAVDEWVFERDVDRGFLGEALAGGLIFPYTAMINEDYLHAQEVRLKKRLILELLENLVLDFPELSYEIYIKPEYFMYEAMLSRARIYPPILYVLSNFMRENGQKERVELVLHGFSEALKQLAKDEVISFADSYVKISRKFVDSARSQRVRFINLSKTVPRTLFTSLLGILPQFLNFLSQNAEIFTKIQRAIYRGNSEAIPHLVDPQKYLYVYTVHGFVSLAERVNIEAFARKALSAGKDATVEVEDIGGVLNDVYLIKTASDSTESKAVVKRFKDWSSFKWFPLTLWTIGTRTFAVLGRSRLERECAMNRFLFSEGFNVPRVLCVNHAERLVFMEYVEGESLDKMIKRIESFEDATEDEKDLETIRRVGEIFAKVHTLNVSLGDTKPENIMVGKNSEIYLLDFEQATRKGDKVWDVAEFLYYVGHYISPFSDNRIPELIAKAFISGYMKAGGSADVVKKAGNPKYTRVFSIFALPHVMFIISSICRRADKLE